MSTSWMLRCRRTCRDPSPAESPHPANSALPQPRVPLLLLQRPQPTPQSHSCFAPSRMCAGTHHFVGCRCLRTRGVGLLAAGQLQAAPLLLHGATLVAFHAVNLLLHAHLHLCLIGKHSALRPLLGRARPHCHTPPNGTGSSPIHLSCIALQRAAQPAPGTPKLLGVSQPGAETQQCVPPPLHMALLSPQLPAQLLALPTLPSPLLQPLPGSQARWPCRWHSSSASLLWAPPPPLSGIWFGAAQCPLQDKAKHRAEPLWGCRAASWPCTELIESSAACCTNAPRGQGSPVCLLEGTQWVAPTFVEGSLLLCLLLLPALQPLSSGARGSRSLRLLLALLQAWFGLWGEIGFAVSHHSAGWSHGAWAQHAATGWHTAPGAGGHTDTWLGSICATQTWSTSGHMGWEGCTALTPTYWGQAPITILVTWFCVG